LRSQVLPQEQVVPNTSACQKSISANHAAGDHAPNVTVIVVITCVEEVYDQQAALALAQNLLMQKAAQELGPNYKLMGNIESTVTQATVVDVHGTVSLLVQAQGTWVYSFSTAGLQTIAQHLTNMSQQNALHYLTTQPGVASAQIELSNGDTLPTDQTKIKIVIKAVASALPQIALNPANVDFGTMNPGTTKALPGTISNRGDQLLTWSVVSTSLSGWLSIAISSGTVAPGSSQSFLVTANTSNLPAGSYTATLNFTSNGGNASLIVTMTVV
jgi:hypothetical protein